MKRVVTEIEIEAPPERVWRMLTGFAELPEWNPFTRNAEGRLHMG